MSQRLRSAVVSVCGLLTLSGAALDAQRIVKASAAWVAAPAAGAQEASAYVVVDNGTMYDVYITAAAADIAGTVEIRQAGAKGAPAGVIKEAAVPSFGQLAMAADGVYLALRQLKQPLAAGATVDITLTLDSGDTLTVAAPVK